MKTLKNYFKPISYLLTSLILLQGCVIYKKKPSSLDEAVHSNTKVRIETKDNQVLKFKRIESKNGQYLGINELLKVYEEINTKTGLIEKRKKMEKLETSLEENNIEKILVKDKTMSTVVPIALPILIIGGTLIHAINNMCIYCD